MDGPGPGDLFGLAGLSIVGLMPDADAAFAALARSTVDGLLERRPEFATLLGEHAHDDRLTIGTAAHYDELARWCADRFAAAAAVNLGQLSAEYRVDAQILFAQLERVLFVTTELREHEWNPMLANPGRAIYLLLARDFAPLPSRLSSVASRLAAVPDALAAARSIAAARLPQVHLETAISQFEGTERLIGPELDRTLAAAPAAAAPAGLAAARAAALDAITGHRRWLEQRLADGDQGAGLPGSADRAGAVRPQAVPHPGVRPVTGGTAGPCPGRPGRDDRADHRDRGPAGGGTASAGS